MKTIEIEDAVYSTLEARVQGFGEKPNDVIKRLLAAADKGPEKTNANGSKQNATPASATARSPLAEFVASPVYLRGNAKDRYFDVLRFIHDASPTEFERLNGFRRGSRVQISKDQTEIRKSGRHTYPQKLDGTDYWVMTNLSNERKQTILEDMMRFLGYDNEIIAVVVKSVPNTRLYTRTGRDAFSSF